MTSWHYLFFDLVIEEGSREKRKIIMTDTANNHTFYVAQLGQTARRAAKILRTLSTHQKNHWLVEVARFITENQDSILQANLRDQANAQKTNKTPAFIDRLSLNQQALYNLATQLESIAALPDPVGNISNMINQPSGIQVGKMRMPIGVILMIYESRPNVTIEAAALAVKSGNAIILRGGSDAIHTNKIFAELMSQAFSQLNLPEGGAQLVEILSHDVVKSLLQASEYIDVVIPRGGKSLVRLVQENALIPVIKHLDGICHTYIDADADLAKAVAIADNAKTQRFGTCNTMETLLVHADIANALFAKLLPIYQAKEIELRVCPLTQVISNKLGVKTTPATEEDWGTEYLAPILSIKIVQDDQAAIQHIHEYGSDHTEVIVTENFSRAQAFLRNIDASSVMVNASSRFADGFEYGLGGEIGISTNKLHVRGPVGLEGLTTEKYIVIGNGHIRQ